MSRRLLGLTVALVVLVGAATGWAQTNLTVVRHSDNTLWKMTCNGTSDCSAWTQFGGGFSNQPTLTWDQILNKYILIGIGNNQSNIWRSTFNEDGTWNNDWTLIGTGATGSPSPVAASGAYYDTLGELTTCGVGQIPKWSGSAWVCAADNAGTGTITAVNAGVGLTGGGTSGSVTLSILPSYLLPQLCAAGQIVSSNGSAWVCANDQIGGGTITGVTAGNGLTGGGSGGSVTLNVGAGPGISVAADTVSVSFGGNGSADTVARSNHNHDSLYVNESQANSISSSMIVSPMDLSGSVSDAGVISGNNSSSTGYGLYGSSSGIAGLGVFGYGPGSYASGVFGYAPATGDVTNFGGRFAADGNSGNGVYGVATASGGGVTNYGGYFSAYGDFGRGVYGYTTGTNGYGVYGEAAGSNGIGVYGEAPAALNVTNYGGYFRANGNSGRGIYSIASGPSGYGVYATSPGTYGIGVYGSAPYTGDVANYGGYFEAAGNYGQGVYGYAAGTNGTGVRGIATATGNIRNYGGYFETHGNWGQGVYGYAPTTGDVVNFGGCFEASGDYGYGVYGYASGTTGIGVVGYALGTYGIGVDGHGSNYDFYAGGPGTNYGPFTGGHEVKLSEDFSSNIKPGVIVSVTGKAQVRRRDDGTVSLSSTLPTVKLSKVARDKAVFGVFVKEVPLPKDHWYGNREGERFATVNALGEGRVWVTNLNGNIEAGDYITTSDLAGYGQRQDDDIVHSYTCGKAIETVDWDSVTETVELNGNTYKAYLIAVVYTSG